MRLEVEILGWLRRLAQGKGGWRLKIGFADGSNTSMAAVGRESAAAMRLTSKMIILPLRVVSTARLKPS